ncbi:hypothetical protein ACNO8S_16445 (plasmid) [Haloarcula sp. KBTZ06]
MDGTFLPEWIMAVSSVVAVVVNVYQLGSDDDDNEDERRGGGAVIEF